MRQTSIWLAEIDDESLEVIRKRYGLSTDSDAVRLALRVLAKSKHVEIPNVEQWLSTKPSDSN